jgi:hypothetical protein
MDAFSRSPLLDRIDSLVKYLGRHTDKLDAFNKNANKMDDLIGAMHMLTDELKLHRMTDEQNSALKDQEKGLSLSKLGTLGLNNTQTQALKTVLEEHGIKVEASVTIEKQSHAYELNNEKSYTFRPGSSYRQHGNRKTG